MSIFVKILMMMIMVRRRCPDPIAVPQIVVQPTSLFCNLPQRESLKSTEPEKAQELIIRHLSARN